MGRAVGVVSSVGQEVRACVGGGERSERGRGRGARSLARTIMSLATMRQYVRPGTSPTAAAPFPFVSTRTATTSFISNACQQHHQHTHKVRSSTSQ